MKKILTAASVFLLPNFATIIVLNLLGHKIHPSAYIGFSLILTRKLFLDAHSKIGHFNIIQVDKLLMRKKAFIKSRNRIRGAMNIMMAKESAIANNNSVYRASEPVTYGNGTLKLGQLGIIVSKHHLDCTRSIDIGSYTTIGGLGTQFWTHGYFHGSKGPERIRIDGPIKIGNNVYVGTSCTFNPGVTIADKISIGSNVCVSKSLQETGMYVAQPLRHIRKEIKDIRAVLDKVDKASLVEQVYEKRTSNQESLKIARYERLDA